MALELGLIARISDGGTLLVLSDNTGVWEATANPTGWGVGTTPPVGSPEPYLKNITAADLVITDPAGTIVNVDLIADLGLTFGVDTIPANLIYPITLTTMGYATKFLDGIYKVNYTVSDGSTSATGVFYRGAFYNIQLELLKKVQGLHRYYTNHQRSYQSYFNDLSTANMLFQQLVNAGHAGDVGSFNAILATLTDMLDVNSAFFNY